MESEETAPFAPEERFSLLSALLTSGVNVSRPAAGGKLADAGKNPLVIVGKFPQTAVPEASSTPETPVFVENIAERNSEQLFQRLDAIRESSAAARPGEWKPWFPVIDYDRCTNCMQCLSFCLFGVYGVDQDRRIQVQNNDNCKTNCPACSRVCPEAAIMFPKYKAGPINGDVVSDADLNREKMKIDISSLLGGDVYQMLRDRSERARSRFSKERDSEKALKERQKCLTKLATQMGDIPAEVLLSLPSPDEIQKRAEEAAAKAKAALEPLPPTTSPAQT
jgi:Pyruvate/2-oxoacid:ferredoxin oxidoreductase delta subunit